VGGIVYAVLALPLFTGIIARGANRIGGFGLVVVAITIHYRPAHARPLVF